MAVRKISWRKSKPQLPRKLRRPGELSPEEQECVKIALRAARARLGGNRELAQAMGVTLKSVKNMLLASRGVSIRVALEVARVVGVTIDDVLTGEYPEVGTCPMCGRCGDE